MDIIIIDKKISSNFTNKILEKNFIKKKKFKVIKFGNQIINKDYKILDLSYFI